MRHEKHATSKAVDGRPFAKLSLLLTDDTDPLHGVVNVLLFFYYSFLSLSLSLSLSSRSLIPFGGSRGLQRSKEADGSKVVVVLSFTASLQPGVASD